MDVPSATEARLVSKVLEERFPAPDGDDALDVWLQVGARLVASLTCRIIGDAAGDDMEEVPADLEPLVRQAIIWRTEVFVERSWSSAARRRAIRHGNLQSISAGPWSESYFGPEQAQKAKQLDPDRDLADLLWAIATPACREGWIALWGGEHAPAATAVAYAYDQRPGGLGLVPRGQEYL